MVALNAETYIPGHGDLATKADLQRKLTATTERRDRIAAMVKQGKSLEEIKAALPDPPAPGAPPAAAPAPRPANAPPPPLTFVETAYKEITKSASK
jgi:hypothetical protein